MLIDSYLVDATLDYLDCNHEHAVVDEDEVSDDHRTCSPDVREVPHGGVDGVEGISADIEDQVV